MDLARVFAATEIARAETDNPRQPQSCTEEIAREENANPRSDCVRFRQHAPDASDEEIDRATALSDFAQQANEAASYDGEERFPNAFDVNDILDRIAAAVKDCRD